MSAAYETVAIEKFKAAWIAAVRASDVDRLLAMVTDDVVAMHPNRQDDKGKAGTRRRFPPVLCEIPDGLRLRTPKKPS